MATMIPVSTAVRMTLKVGEDENGKQISKNVSISNVNEAVEAEALAQMTGAFAQLLKYPVTAVKKYSVVQISGK